MCKCSYCAKSNLFNFNYINSMENDVSTLENPVQSARERIWKIFLFFLGFLRYVGFFVLGIIIGMGIVLKDPPASREQQLKIVQLEKQNAELKAKIENKFNDKSAPDVSIKNAFVID